ncbi:2-oxo acid dehydrogenase subunit E2 [Streptomyces lasiicapitis]|uniref:2-oxo acid dehydrogenase subunit E2 n=1 Tax=Streptomyces lasiicapitis TaxID=1923961 RepID=UPI003316C716
MTRAYGAAAVADVPGAAADRRVFSSPLARRLAREAGLSPEGIPGTGPGGRVVRRDVVAAIARGKGVSVGEFVDSKHSVPHLYLRGSARVGELLALRRRLNEYTGREGTAHITVNDLLLKAAALAHRAVPALNVVRADETVPAYDSVDVAIAVATEHGLVTPVLRAADRLSLTALAETAADLAARARTGRLDPHELVGGTLALINLGAYGTEEFAAVISPPRAATLAVGASRDEAVVVDGQVRAEPVLRATLSVDHRLVDGAVAARWMREFTSLLEQPTRLLL